ncbi:hypothetical protein [Dyadobacter psychrotolerans]|nr:hypothetical protein [Dyadobacter psychrotolerans]
MRKLNMAMALKWFVFLPMILPACVIFGAIQGMMTMADKVWTRMWLDIEKIEVESWDKDVLL